MEASSQIVQTPLGSLRIEVRSADAGHLMGKYSLVLLPVNPMLPPGMSVNEVTAALLTLTPTADLADVVFSCLWVESPAMGGPETGQGLDAQSWQSKDHIVLIGTEDFEMLSLRHPECNFREEHYPVEYLPNGMRLRVPKVAQNKTVTFHFIIASNKYPEPTECSAWFAVDMPHAQIAEAAANEL